MLFFLLGQIWTLMTSSHFSNSPFPITYFVFNDSIYKQVHGCAMGSPVGPVVANRYMEEIVESTISNSSQ